MASNIITAGATESCTHGGTIKLTPADPTLTIGGNAVYTESALAGATIGCPLSSGPCVVAADAGSTVLVVNGQAVLLADKLKTGPTAPASLSAAVLDAPTFVTTV